MTASDARGQMKRYELPQIMSMIVDQALKGNESVSVYHKTFSKEDIDYLEGKGFGIEVYELPPGRMVTVINW